MKTLLFSGLAASVLLFAGSAAEASDSSKLTATAGASDSVVPAANARKRGATHNPGMPKMRAPRPRPGMHGIPHHGVYRRPFRGFVVPRYWVQPSFYIPNYTIYGLTAPSRGYNWSRYYDDAVLLDGRGYVQDYRSGVDWNAQYSGEGAHHDRPDYGPSIRADAKAYDWGDDGNVAFAAPDGSSYSYDGEWQGEYVDPARNVFEGEWQGTVTRHGAVPHHAGAPYPGGPGHNGNNYYVPRGYEGYERCLKSNGLTGAAIGAILGGVAGNRIAGRGDRLGGTLLGAGLGGLAGSAIEKATSKCESYEPPHVSYPPQHYQQGYQHHQSWQGGYYYYPQAPMVTVTVVPGASHTTTTVTEEVYYETVKTYPRKKAARKWKPKPKPRCVCR